MSTVDVTRIGTGRWRATINGEPVELSRLEQHLAIQDALLLSAEREGAEVVIEHDIAYRVRMEPSQPDPEPEAWTVDATQVLYPESIELDSLGEHEVEIIAVVTGSDGLTYAPTEVAGEPGWLEVVVEGEGSAVSLWAYPGAEWRPDPDAGIVLEFDDPDAAEWDGLIGYPIAELPAEDPVLLVAGPEHVEAAPTSAADLAAPGQPQFAATETGAVVSWTASAGADGYRVEWRGEDVLTSETSVEVEGFVVGDWACVWPRIGQEEGPSSHCNTWTDA